MDILKNNLCEAVLILKKGEGRTIKAGGSWIYDNEIDRIDGSFKDGNILRVEDFDGYPMGWGFINTKSKITVRMLTRNAEEEMNDDRNRVANGFFQFLRKNGKICYTVPQYNSL